MRSQEVTRECVWACVLCIFGVNWEDMFCVLHMCWTEASSLRFLSCLHGLCWHRRTFCFTSELYAAFCCLFSSPSLPLPFTCPYHFEKWKSSRKWRTQTCPVNDGWWALSGLDYSRMVKAGSAGLSGHPQVAMVTSPKRWITRRETNRQLDGQQFDRRGWKKAKAEKQCMGSNANTDRKTTLEYCRTQSVDMRTRAQKSKEKQSALDWEIIKLAK